MFLKNVASLVPERHIESKSLGEKPRIVNFKLAPQMILVPIIHGHTLRSLMSVQTCLRN